MVRSNGSQTQCYTGPEKEGQYTLKKRRKKVKKRKKKKLVKCDIVPYRYVLLGVLMIFFFFFPFLFVVLFHFCTFNGVHLNLCIFFKKNLNLFRTFFFLCVCVLII